MAEKESKECKVAKTAVLTAEAAKTATEVALKTAVGIEAAAVAAAAVTAAAIPPLAADEAAAAAAAG